MTEEKRKPTLYEQIGGESEITALIDDFYKRVLADEMLAPFFANTKMRKQRKMQQEFFAAALGWPGQYASVDLRAAHAGRGITDKHLTRFTEHLIQTLEDRNLQELHVNEIIARIATYSRYILGESNVDG